VELIIKQLHKVLLGIERRLKQAMLDNNDEEPASGPLIWQKMLLQYVNTKLQMVYALCYRYMGNQKAVDLKVITSEFITTLYKTLHAFQQNIVFFLFLTDLVH